MKRVRQTSNCPLQLWVFMFATMLRFNQGIKLHAHDFDHGLAQQHGGAFAEYTADQQHSDSIHLSMDPLHDDHHQSMTSEFDVTPNGLFRNLTVELPSLISTVIALFALPPLLLRQACYRRGDEVTHLLWRYPLCPPLRGPLLQVTL
jgi:hypothetical protein